ncbi:Lin1244/Lin1753 domain-containing protein [Desulfosediminicola ganghwensis]|uniref:Lin1244/Lin1753 domain-containing protein n=1 Tax=Desulfosediminicola ganghwensis TaxID=2569540 RepID=UPI0010AD2B60|nr:Lin1244/Lin1753 domain-containing protein [Desulfosediminicola ganghwensis]
MRLSKRRYSVARPRKETVEYFPHDVHHGKTLYSLQNSFGNDGYAAWFKLLELLGRTHGHSYSIQEPADLYYLAALWKVSGEKTMQILDFLSELQAIDPQLYDNKIIWCDNFVKNLEPVYLKRRTPLPEKPNSRSENDSSRAENSTSIEITGNSGARMQQSKLKESIDKTNTASSDTDDVYEDFYLSKKEKKLTGQILWDFNLFWKTFDYRKGKAEAADAFLTVYQPDLIEDILIGAEREAIKRQTLIAKGQTPKMAQGWIGGRRWEDEEQICMTTSNDCTRCNYNHPKPCPNLSKPDFNPENCDSFQTVEAGI